VARAAHLKSSNGSIKVANVTGSVDAQYLERGPSTLSRSMAQANAETIEPDNSRRADLRQPRSRNIQQRDRGANGLLTSTPIS